MATITSTAAGGAWSSTASWVGGVVPGATDSVVIAATSGGITMDAAYTTTGTVTLTNGTFDVSASNYALTCASFSSNNSNTRTLTLRSSTITCTGALSTAWDTGTTTGLTITANTATIVFNGAGPTILLGGLNLNGASLSSTGSGVPTFVGGATVANWSRAGTAVKTDGLVVGSGSWVVTGTFTMTGNSSTNRVLIYSSTVGTSRTITAAAVALSNCDFMDIAGAGAASWTGTSLGDCGGNSGITFSPATTRYAVAAGNWSSTAVWSTSSGGSSGASVPLPQDNVVLNASSGVGTITVDMPRVCKDLTCTGYSGTLALGAYTGVARAVYGSLTLAAGMTLTGNEILNLAGRGSHLLTTNGIAIAADTFRIGSATGTYGLGSALTHTGTALCTATLGVFNTNDYAVTCKSININNFVAGTSNFGASTVTLTTAATVVDAYGTVNAGTSTFVVSDTSTATKTFTGRGKTYNNLVIQGGALNSVVITGANTFNTITAPAGTVLTLPSSTTTTVAGLALTGSKYDGLRLPGTASNWASTPSTAALQITGDIEIVARVMNSGTGLGGSVLRKGYAGCYGLILSNTAIGMEIKTGGSTSYPPVSASLPYGTAVWVRLRRVAATGVVTAHYAADQAAEPTSWTLAGSTTPGLYPSGNLDTDAQSLGLGGGASGSTENMAGVLYRAIVRNGIGGTTVFDADFTAKPWGANSFVESSSNAATVTINGDLAKAGDGRVLLVSSTPGTAATLTKGGGVVAVSRTVVVDTAASGMYARLCDSSRSSGTSSGWKTQDTTYIAFT